MAENYFRCLELERESGTGSTNPLDPSRCHYLKEQLLHEIQALEEQLLMLKDSAERIDFSMQQTCREMIHSRQQLFRKLQG
ncbi:MAG: hypothetical protein AAGI24_10020 [Pseudomonadota bacterium]